RTEHEFGLSEAAQKCQEGGRPIEVKKERRLLLHGIVTDAASFLVPGNVIAVQLPFDTLRLRNQRSLDKLARQELRNDDELVLIPIVSTHSFDIQFGNGLVSRFSHRA